MNSFHRGIVFTAAAQSRRLVACGSAVVVLGWANATPWPTLPRPVQSPSSVAINSALFSNLPSTSNRISWLGKLWFLMGANMAWYQWDNDFRGIGTGDDLSVQSNYSAVDAKLRQASAAGLHTIRWWTFVCASGVQTDSSDVPVAVNSAVYGDFDLALRLARKYDIYYVFDLCDDPNGHKNIPWNNDAYPSALASALSPMFARYRGNPHILAWEVFNEPEYSVWDGTVSMTAEQNIVKAIATAVHANSTAYATVGSAEMSQTGNWTGIGLDFVSPHDYWAEPRFVSTFTCPLCLTYDQLADLVWGVGPIIVGEWQPVSRRAGDPPAAQRQRWETLYHHGFAGAWPWTLIPENTSDGPCPNAHCIDFDAATMFYQEHTDLGPHR
jgi:hypothetical protein